MDTEIPLLHIRVQVHDTATGVPLAEVLVQLQSTNDAHNHCVLVQGRTGPDGIAVLDLDSAFWRHELIVCTAEDGGSSVSITRAILNGEEDAMIEVTGTNQIDHKQFRMLAEHLIATRRVRTDDVVSNLVTPERDSIVRMLSVDTRARLLADISQALKRDNKEDIGDAFIIDPHALRDGSVRLVPVSDLPHQLEMADKLSQNTDLYTRPGFGWEVLPWALSDDQSYRDYLRSVFVLFAHQQKLGRDANPTKFSTIVESQLQRRFFQDFRTVDHTKVSLNKLLIPIVTKILTAPVGSGFGFARTAAAVPVQDTHTTDRQYLDALLAAAPVTVLEFANRYRLPLNEPDSTQYSPMTLNIYTLSRVLSDTAQGPVEPHDNIIEPQLPDEKGKPILWEDVVGAAPFFLRFDEWLARQQPFFGENLFALRSQVESIAHGPWLNDDCKRFLEFHKNLPSTFEIKESRDYFGSIDEIHRSAQFLLDYGVADAKLAELVQAIDKNNFGAAQRLANEAERLLEKAVPNPWAEKTGNFRLMVLNHPASPDVVG